ncbi:hypothetical protein EPN44_15015 [bacterium]|nr:MAG: hypothetical protein EPN44_15015 [bacterium]
MQARVRWRSMPESHRTRRRSGMWRPCWTPTGAIEAPRSRATLAALICCALTLLAASPAVADPSPSDILALHARAVHPASAVTEPSSTEILGRVEGSGLSGTFREYHLGGKTRSEIHLGPIDDLTVADAMHVWKSDENGNVRELTGILRARNLTADFVASGAYLKDPSSLSYLERSSSDGRPCYAFAVQAPGGDRQRICIDAQSYLLDSHEFEEGNELATMTFADYREVNGLPLAFSAVETHANLDRSISFTIERVFLNRVFDASIFARPTSRYVDLPAQHVIVSMHRTRNGYEVPVEIDKHDYWFLLDSGAQGIVIDQRVAKDIGVRAAGQLRAVGARAVSGLGMARIAALSVGGATLRNVTVGVLDLSAASGGSFVANGVLGYPFFDAAVLRMDPHAMTLEIEAPGSADPRRDGERLTIELDRQVPIVDAGIGRDVRGPCLIDTGSSAELLLYQRFVERHPGIVPLPSQSRTGNAIGGALTLHDTTLPQLNLGSVALYNVLAGVVVASHGAFADRFDAGNIGMGILRNFVLTFDEPDGALYVRRGADFDDGRFRPQYDPLGLPQSR